MTNDLSKEIKRNLKYYKNVKEQLKAMETKDHLNHLRKNWLEKQNKLNYSLEYNRILGQIQHSTVRGATVANLEKLNQRKEFLENLGAQAFSI